MVVVCRGFGEFKLSDEIDKVACPQCNGAKTLNLRNLGFVKCTWSIKGILALPNGLNTSLISLEGKCYDSCLYTMKEIDIKWAW